jgi:hypothetical protein
MLAVFHYFRRRRAYRLAIKSQANKKIAHRDRNIRLDLVGVVEKELIFFYACEQLRHGALKSPGNREVPAYQ